MQLWTPPRDEPELLTWWAPLLLVGRRVRAEGLPWPIQIDQFHLLGRVERGGSRQPIWVYRHKLSGGDIFADPTGQTYRYRPTPKATGPGRFDRCELRKGVQMAGLPEVAEPAVGEGDVVAADSSWSQASEARAMAAHPTAGRRTRCRPARARVLRQDRWLHMVPALPA